MKIDKDRKYIIWHIPNDTQKEIDIFTKNLIKKLIKKTKKVKIEWNRKKLLENSRGCTINIFENTIYCGIKKDYDDNLKKDESQLPLIFVFKILLDSNGLKKDLIEYEYIKDSGGKNEIIKSLWDAICGQFANNKWSYTIKQIESDLEALCQKE